MYMVFRNNKGLARRARSVHWGCGAWRGMNDWIDVLSIAFILPGE
jgi:hypothetical protein